MLAMLVTNYIRRIDPPRKDGEVDVQMEGEPTAGYRQQPVNKKE